MGRSDQSIWLWREINSTLGGCTSGPSGKSSDLVGSWVRPTCWYWRVSCKEQLRLTADTRMLVVAVLESVPCCEPAWKVPFSHQDLAQPNSPGLMLGCLRPHNQQGGNIVPPSRRLSTWSLLEPTAACCPLDMALAQQGDKTHQWKGNHLTGRLHKPLRPASSTRGQTAQARTMTLQNRNCNHRKSDKMRRQRNFSQTNEQVKPPKNN